jgi:hypothetical protein
VELSRRLRTVDVLVHLAALQQAPIKLAITCNRVRSWLEFRPRFADRRHNRDGHGHPHSQQDVEQAARHARSCVSRRARCCQARQPIPTQHHHPRSRSSARKKRATVPSSGQPNRTQTTQQNHSADTTDEQHTNDEPHALTRCWLVGSNSSRTQLEAQSRTTIHRSSFPHARRCSRTPTRRSSCLPPSSFCALSRPSGNKLLGGSPSPTPAMRARAMRRGSLARNSAAWSARIHLS